MPIYIGTSGYVYDDWQGPFYPTDLPRERWLEYYSQQFSIVEVNLTFYRLPASPVFRHWAGRTPQDFQFVLKGSRQITHLKRLDNCHEELAVFFERASELGDKLRTVLWQLPPKFSHDPDLLELFLAEVERVQVVFGRFRQAFEFRDISWFHEEVYEILARFGVAVVLADWPFAASVQEVLFRSQDDDIRPRIVVPLTADFLYVRCHGPATPTGSAYTPDDINYLANALRPPLVGKDGYIFFRNKTNAYAVQNAQGLKAALEA